MCIKWDVGCWGSSGSRQCLTPFACCCYKGANANKLPHHDDNRTIGHGSGSIAVPCRRFFAYLYRCAGGQKITGWAGAEAVAKGQNASRGTEGNQSVSKLQGVHEEPLILLTQAGQDGRSSQERRTTKLRCDVTTIFQRIKVVVCRTDA